MVHKKQIENIKVTYNNKNVNAKRITVSSSFDAPADRVWKLVKTSLLLENVCKGIITFKPLKLKFPTEWKQGETIATRMVFFGFIPLIGIHHLYFKEINEETKQLITEESDIIAKIWNHTISVKELENGKCSYTDEVIVYGGFLTNFVASFALKLYLHRQRRWLKYI